VFYPGICLTTEEKARKNLSQGKKNLSQVNQKPQSEYSIHITKAPTHYKTLTNTHTHTHILQNNIKPPQYKLKQNAYRKSNTMGRSMATISIYSVSLRHATHNVT